MNKSRSTRKNRKSKLLPAILIALLAALMLAGCTQAQPEEETGVTTLTEVAPQAPGPVEVTGEGLDMVEYVNGEYVINGILPGSPVAEDDAFTDLGESKELPSADTSIFTKEGVWDEYNLGGLPCTQAISHRGGKIYNVSLEINDNSLFESEEYTLYCAQYVLDLKDLLVEKFGEYSHTNLTDIEAAAEILTLAETQQPLRFYYTWQSEGGGYLQLLLEIRESGNILIQLASYGPEQEQ